MTIYKINMYKTRETNGIPSPTYFQHDNFTRIWNSYFKYYLQMGNILTHLSFLHLQASRKTSTCELNTYSKLLPWSCLNITSQLYWEFEFKLNSICLIDLLWMLNPFFVMFEFLVYLCALLNLTRLWLWSLLNKII